MTDLRLIVPVACDLCGDDRIVELPPDWQAQVDDGAAIPIIGCGNPWHYIPLRDKAAQDALQAVVDAARALRDEHMPDPDHPDGQGYDDTIPGGYGSIDPVCKVCGTSDEYGVPWPCATYTRLNGPLDGLEA